jgi:hypothetical protein
MLVLKIFMFYTEGGYKPNLLSVTKLKHFQKRLVCPYGFVLG